jgi:hypothetical protein
MKLVGLVERGGKFRESFKTWVWMFCGAARRILVVEERKIT